MPVATHSLPTRTPATHWHSQTVGSDLLPGTISRLHLTAIY